MHTSISHLELEKYMIFCKTDIETLQNAVVERENITTMKRLIDK